MTRILQGDFLAPQKMQTQAPVNKELKGRNIINASLKVHGKWALSVKHNVTFCLLNQSSHQSEHTDGMENRFRMSDRIWEWNTEAARAAQSKGHPLTQDKPSSSPNPLLSTPIPCWVAASGLSWMPEEGR